jgi:Domain of unknown function (DUF4440)
MFLAHRLPLRPLCACTAAAILAAACASRGRQGSEAGGDVSGLRSLVAAERAFARHSERAGIKESFVANLGVDGVLFRPGPVNGLEWFRDRPAPRAYLSWEPEVAAISASGDMGFTTGPWELRATGASDSVSGAGHYVTVWKRDSTGTWKMAVDIGTSHARVPRPTDVAGSVISATASLGPDAKQAIMARDSLLGKSGGAPQSAVLIGAMAPDARLHREGALPALGIDAVRAAMAGDDRPYHSKPLGAAASRAGDFGYTYGEYELVATFTRPAERGFYLRLWRPGEDGTWRIILDLAQPVRPPG